MLRKFTAFLLLVALVCALIPVYADDKTEYLDADVVFEADFENNLQINKGNITVANASVTEMKNNKVLSLNSRAGGANFVVYTDSPTECEATLISLDMQFDSKVCRGYMDIFKPVAQGKTPSFDIKNTYRSLYVTHENRIAYFEKFPTL